MITALSVVSAMIASGKPLSELKSVVTKYPQSLINIRVKKKKELMEVAAIVDAIRNAEDTLGERGRVLVRYSGTETLARVMVEGEKSETVDTQARLIADAVETSLG
jgi:phosphoglucosamine mutase